jgi:predicted GNAT superfamily acetyltransferase
MLREYNQTDLQALLFLNNASVPAVNKLNIEELKSIIAMAEKCWIEEIDDEVAAALIVLGPGKAYTSDNYTWLETQFTNYCYVDRIMVNVDYKRRGLGNKLYKEFEKYATHIGTSTLLCEVNIEPPNPQSIAFHMQFGWEPFFEREHGPGKKVQYFKKNIIPDQT